MEPRTLEEAEAILLAIGKREPMVVLAAVVHEVVETITGGSGQGANPGNRSLANFYKLGLYRRAIATLAARGHTP